MYRAINKRPARLAAVLMAGSLALATPTLATAKHVPCGKNKPHHTNCGKHKGAAKGNKHGHSK
jgi:hypothetical protein